MIKLKYATLLIFVLLPQLSFGMTLSEERVFERCYMQLTQRFPAFTHPLMTKVRNKVMSAVSACHELIDKTSLTDQSGQFKVDTNDSEQVNILNNLHSLHYSWFSIKNYPEITDSHARNVANVSDDSTPALYITRALFDSEFKFRDIFTGDVSFRSVRSNYKRSMSLKLGRGERLASDDVLQGVLYTGTGTLHGMEVQPKDLTYNVISYDKDPRSNEDAKLESKPDALVNTHWGGGVLGSQVYLLQNIQGSSLNYSPNGGTVTNRKWSRNLVKDFFCRELPVIRDQDATAYVSETSSITFRNTKGCVKCHATIDPMAALTRNANYTRVARFFDPGGHYTFLVKKPTDRTDKSYFPLENDNDFSRRPTKGHLYIRSFNGDLIYKQVDNLEELAQEALKLDDMYVCMAKRYFKYFTGVDVDLSDVKDPSNNNFPSLSASQTKYRNIVINLGKDLKNSQDMKKLIKDILSLDLYKQHDYGVSQN